MVANLSGISVVVPVYQSSEAVLEELVKRLSNVLSTLERSHEVILVNDGSLDATWDIIVELARKFPVVRGLDLMRNYGQHAALATGVQQSCHGIIVTLDDDLEQPPEAIPQLIEKLDEGYDLVYGVPNERRRSWLRNLSAQIAQLILTLSTRVRISSSALRAFRGDLKTVFSVPLGGATFDSRLNWIIRNATTVPVPFHYSRRGRTSFSLARLTTLFVDGITTLTLWPLKLVAFAGLLSVAAGTTLCSVVAFSSASQETFLSPRSLLGLVLLLFGLQAIALGILGEYVGRLHWRSLGVGTPVVRQTTRQAAG